MHGYDTIPCDWIDRLEVREEIDQLSHDWNALRTTVGEIEWKDDRATRRWRDRYPGW